MRRALVTQRLGRDAVTGEERDALDVRWARFLAGLGMALVPVPSGAPLAAWLAAVGRPDGVVLTGGNDLGSVSGNELDLRRDRLEEELLEWAVADGIPVLAVCRGLQLIGTRAGGRLARVEGHVRAHHPLIVEPGTRLSAHGELPVNSFHSWGLSGEPEGYRVTARSPDGGIEALEHATRPVVGVMWHPEREEPARSADRALVAGLFGLEAPQ